MLRLSGDDVLGHPGIHSSFVRGRIGDAVRVFVTELSVRGLKLRSQLNVRDRSSAIGQLTLAEAACAREPVITLARFALGNDDVAQIARNRDHLQHHPCAEDVGLN